MHGRLLHLALARHGTGTVPDLAAIMRLTAYEALKGAAMESGMTASDPRGAPTDSTIAASAVILLVSKCRWP